MLSVIGHNAARGPCLAGRATTRTSIRNGCALQQQYGRRKGVILCAQSATEDSEVAEDDGISVAATKQVRLRTAKGSRLAVSIYPSFVYNAQGGGGIGVAEVGEEGLINVKFDAKDIYIPDLYFRTTTFLGLPLPWPFRIAVEPKRLEGTVDFESGDVDLEFVADFKFTAGSVYKAPNLKVLTHLTTGTVQGRQHSGTGQRLINGKGRIVGVANLDPTGDSFLDRFLMLPADCYADLQADFELV